ncbi:DUF885 domain-containing protein [Shewanella avicenniae]|uniref:DUF885 domain-containing protein n=1 Tax=Shewanella avicenniae TaxID=2814294 RepID=A0ABX7QW62_9GAMM|nr:DUF885 domain-containing protein [Shewanella avicenniae]QSX35186.1 DUF885 domain-containing protein [Shewanella avicenniae]
MKKMLLLACAVSCSLSAAEPQWVTTSNQYAINVLSVMATQQPEMGSQLGIEQVDGLAADLSMAAEQRAKQTTLAEITKLSVALKSEADPRVKQDLQIMIDTLQQQINASDIAVQYALPFYNVSEFIFNGLQTLLDERNSAERKQKAMARLQHYVGMTGNDPIVTQAMQRTEAALANKQLKTPYYIEVEQAIENTEKFLDGIKGLFETNNIADWQPAFDTLSVQLRQYQQWLKKTVLPIASKSNVMPLPMYQSALKGYGVDVPPQQLMQQALFTFAEIRDEMQVLATDIAAQQGLKDNDYRAVIRTLKQKQITGDNVLPFFKQRLTAIEEIVKQHDIVSMPKRQANIRVASAAETAVSPAAHMNPPRLIGNQGEYGEFVLPMLDPHSKGNDFTGEGFSWTLTAHEARPGHELQFTAMVENGVSTARAIFAMNSANVEGWALYAEAVMKQYFPKEGQLFVLQARLQRAARAFLDPMLNLGMISPAEAEKVLTDDVVLSPTFAKHEVERYTFRMPGQATSYFYGYMNLRELRVTTEMALRGKFNQKDFHDFILAQGLLPPKLLKKAVEEEFIPAVK